MFFQTGAEGVLWEESLPWCSVARGIGAKRLVGPDRFWRSAKNIHSMNMNSISQCSVSESLGHIPLLWYDDWRVIIVTTQSDTVVLKTIENPSQTHKNSARYSESRIPRGNPELSASCQISPHLPYIWFATSRKYFSIWHFVASWQLATEDCPVLELLTTCNTIFFMLKPPSKHVDQGWVLHSRTNLKQNNAQWHWLLDFLTFCNFSQPFKF